MSSCDLSGFIYIMMLPNSVGIVKDAAAEARDKAANLTYSLF